jgi:hypothetical protein
MMCKADYAAYVRSIMPDQNSIWKAGTRQKGAVNMRYAQYIMGNLRMLPCLSGVSAGIYFLTYRHKYIYISHGQKQNSRFKVSSPPATGQPQFSSRKSYRSPVRRLKIFRCPRPGPGQVRDGAQGPGGPSACQQQCNGLRLFPTFLLSSAGPARQRRPGSPGTAKARAAAQAQARCRGDAVPSETEIGRPIVETGGSGRTHSGAVRPQDTCTQRGTGAGATGKKTSVITHNGTAESVEAAYEELRSHMLAGSPGGPHSGTVMLLREGIAAWIERRIACRQPAAQSAPPSVPRPLLSDQFHTEIVQVLADIALKHREEMIL